MTEKKEDVTIYKNDIELQIQLAFEDMQQGGTIADLKQSQFSYLLGCVGSVLFSNRELKSVPCQYNDYDIDKLYIIYDIYIMLCNKYNKIPSIMDYALLCNIDYVTVINWKYEKTNSKRNELHKKLTEKRENGLKNRCLDSNNIIGTITIGNSESGWNTGGTIQHITNNIITADALPILKTTQKSILTKNE